MPVVRANREVSTAPLPGVRKSAAETPLSRGAGLAQAQGNVAGAISDVGNDLARVGLAKLTQIQQEARDLADQTAALEFNNGFSSFSNTYLNDPKVGALSKLGKNAMGLPEDAAAQFTKVAGEIEKTVGNTRQRMLFNRIKAEHGDRLNLTVQRHVLGQVQEHAKQTLEATIENAHNAAGAQALDPDAVAIEINRGVSAIQGLGSKLGWGTEEVQRQKEAFTSKTVGTVVTRLLNKDLDKQARAYLDDAKEKGLLTDGDLIAQLEKALDVGTTRAEGQRRADAILAEGGTLTEQRAKARNIEDAEVRDAVQQRLEHEAAVKDREERETEKATMRGAYDILDRTANVNKIPASTWATFDGGTRSAMRSYAEHKAKGTPVVTDLPTYYGLVQKAMDDPEAFATTNLLTHRHQLDEVEFKQLAGLQLNIISGNRTASEKDLGGLRTTRQVVDDTLDQYGIKTSGAKQTAGEITAVAQLRRMVDQAVAEEGARTGKKPDAVFVQKTADRILSQSTTTPGSWWNVWPGGKAVSDTTTRLIDTKIGDIPASERTQVEEALKRRGRPVSDATILDLWLTTKTRLGGR